MDFFLNAVGVPLYTTGTAIHTFSMKASADLVGTIDNDVFWGNSGYAGNLFGGLGDDRYYIYSLKNTPVELPGEGIDTVNSYVSFKLPDNIENLSVSGADNNTRFAFGNSLDNIINGGAGKQQIDGFAGNDVLAGGAGADTFIFTKGNGDDLVRDFGLDDTARIGSYGYKSFAQVMSHMTQVGADVKLTYPNREFTIFQNKSVADFTPANFQLALDKSHFKLTFEDRFHSLSLWNGIKGAGASGTWDSNFFWGQANGHIEPGQSSWMIDTDYGPTKALVPQIFQISSDRHLTITAEQTPADMAGFVNGAAYVSGRLNTHYSFSQLYGYFEMRAELPSNAGDWPAFWLLPQNDQWPPELDAIELRSPNTLLQTVHSKASGTHTYVASQPAVESTAGYHTYGVLWTPQEVVWYFDGTETARAPTPADTHTPMFMVIDHGTSPAAHFTSDAMNVDYVRAWQLPADQLV